MNGHFVFGIFFFKPITYNITGGHGTTGGIVPWYKPILLYMPAIFCLLFIDTDNRGISSLQILTELNSTTFLLRISADDPAKRISEKRIISILSGVGVAILLRLFLFIINICYIFCELVAKAMRNSYRETNL